MKPEFRPYSIAGMVLGFVLVLGPVAGFINTILGMRRAFHQLDSSGISNPKGLEQTVSVMLYSTIASIVLGAIGLVLFFVSLSYYLRRPAATPPPLPAKSE